MATTSFTSEYDEKYNYREALLDRLSELILSNYHRLTNLSSISVNQKTTKDGIVKVGRTNIEEDPLVLFKLDSKANQGYEVYIEQLLNIFATHGNTSETNYGIPVSSIELYFNSDLETAIPYITAPGLPNIQLPDMTNFLSGTTGQFIDLNNEKQTFYKEKVKEYLNTDLQEILPKNNIMARKIKRWFDEFDSLKHDLEKGLKPVFKTDRELLEGDTESLTYLAREALNLLAPQSHPIYTSDNYFNTESALIQLDNEYKSEKQRLQDFIDLLSIQSVSKDKLINFITDNIIPILTEKYVAQLTLEGNASVTFTAYDRPLIEIALQTGNFAGMLGVAIYYNGFEDLNIPEFANNYNMSNAAAQSEGVVSGDWGYYHGIAIACKPGEYKSHSIYGMRNQWSGTNLANNGTIIINEQYYPEGRSHRHRFHRHHFTVYMYYGQDGSFRVDPQNFVVTHPNGEEFNATVAASGVQESGTGNLDTYDTSIDKNATITNVSPAGLDISDLRTPPIQFSNQSPKLNAQYTHTDGVTYTFDYTWGFHTKYNSSTNASGFSSGPTNMPWFIAYIGGDTSRFSTHPEIGGGIGVIGWDGEKWYYDKGQGTFLSSATFKPRYDDFIIFELGGYHWATAMNLKSIGDEDRWNAVSDIPAGVALSYLFGNKKGSGDWIAGRAQGGYWSGYLRKRFSAGLAGTENWRDHGDPRGTWGLIDVSKEQGSSGGGADSNVLRLTINNTIINQNKAAAYNGQWEGARKYFNYVGHDNHTAISLNENQEYSMYIQIRASRPGIKWEVKIGDYRHGQQAPTWEYKITNISQNTDWGTYVISGIKPIARGNEDSNNLFSQYAFPTSDAIGQILVGLQPRVFDHTSGIELSLPTCVSEAVDEYIEVENVAIYASGTEATPA